MAILNGRTWTTGLAQWTLISDPSDPYKFCFYCLATHVTSQVLQPKSVHKRYRGRHTFISLYWANFGHILNKLSSHLVALLIKVGRFNRKQTMKMAPGGLKGSMLHFFRGASTKSTQFDEKRICLFSKCKLIFEWIKNMFLLTYQKHNLYCKESNAGFFNAVKARFN